MGDDLRNTNTAAHDDFNSLKQIIDCLRPHDEEGKIHLLRSVITFLRLESAFGAKPAQSPLPYAPATTTTKQSLPGFSDRIDMTPKQFLLEKQPADDIERVACLGYYLTHYRNTQEFKTLDISQLNTEAAQPKFSNAAVPVDNARQRGFLVVASGGKKQLGALGEQFVQALPDREGAKKVMDRMRIRKPRKKRNDGQSESDGESSSEGESTQNE